MGQKRDERKRGEVGLQRSDNYNPALFIFTVAVSRASNQASPRHIVRMYTRRMWIEEMFGDMKGHGFDLEPTHLDDQDRISRLVLGVCIAYVWLIALGSWVIKRGFRHLIDLKSRRDKSYFCLGWDWLERCLLYQMPIPIHFAPVF